MNQSVSQRSFPGHPKGSKQGGKASSALFSVRKLKAKGVLLGVVTLLVATIISSCGETPTPSPSSSTPTLTPGLTATPSPPKVTPTPTPKPSPGAIFVGKTLVRGYNMGVNTSEGRTDWVKVENGEIRMDYPNGQSWGAVFITVGASTQPPRPGKDFSQYHQLSLELRGQTGGESVSIGVKDKDQKDDGTETVIPVSGLTTEWKTFTFPLSQFKGAHLDKLYVVTEFVFADTPATVYARNIQYQ